MSDRAQRYQIVRDVAGQDLPSLDDRFDAWIIGVSEKSPRYPTPRVIYLFDKGLEEACAANPPSDEELGAVVIMTHIDRMAKEKFWKVIRRPTPFLAQLNDAVAGIAHLPGDSDVVLYNYGKVKAKESRIRGISEPTDPGADSMLDKLMGTDMGPLSPMFATIPFAVP